MTHHIFMVDGAETKAAVVRRLASGDGRRLLFMRTKHQAKKLAKQLTAEGIPAVDLHGNLSQNARERNLEAFSCGDVKVLVATDIAARGIHVDDVELVVHVDPPAEHKAYLHRSGRTARAGSGGDVVTLVLPEQNGDVRTLTRLAKITATPQRVRVGDAVLEELVGPAAPYVDPDRRADPDPAHRRPSQQRLRRAGPGPPGRQRRRSGRTRSWPWSLGRADRPARPRGLRRPSWRRLDRRLQLDHRPAQRRHRAERCGSPAARRTVAAAWWRCRAVVDGVAAEAHGPRARFARWLLRVARWQLVGTVPRRAIVIGAPHTSNWDFVFTLLTIWADGISPHVLVKREMFWWPMGAIMRSLGAIETDREGARGLVERLTREARESEDFVLVLAPGRHAHAAPTTGSRASTAWRPGAGCRSRSASSTARPGRRASARRSSSRVRSASTWTASGRSTRTSTGCALAAAAPSGCAKRTAPREAERISRCARRSSRP